MMVNCKRCGNEFSTKPSQRKLGYGFYCSRACFDANRRTGKNVSCAQCSGGFYAPRKQLRLSKSRNYFCQKKCYLEYKAVHLIHEGHPMWKHGENAYLFLMRRKQKQKCVRCGTKICKILVVHHVDKNRRNNVLSNLVWLCRNCHFLVHKYDETWRV